MSIRRLSIPSLLAGALAAMAAPLIGADNLAPNPDFDTDTSPWTSDDPRIAITFSPVDADANIHSGSLVATNSAPEGLNSAIRVCIPVSVEGGAKYDLGLNLLHPSGLAKGQFACSLTWFSVDACDFDHSLPFTFTSIQAFSEQSNQWLPLAATGVTAPAAAQHAEIQCNVIKNFPNALPYTVYLDDVTFQETGGCLPNAQTLCLDDQPGDRRFKVQVEFETVQSGGRSGPGRAVPAVPIQITRGGIFWFFRAENPELLIKVLNGCDINQRYWVFYSAGTNVGFTITVTDTLLARTKTYTNPDLRQAPPRGDVDALPCS